MTTLIAVYLLVLTGMLVSLWFKIELLAEHIKGMPGQGYDMMEGESRDIVEVIGDYVDLRTTTKGGRWSALCPFHKEETPSFTVDDATQQYHCFGCGAHGGSLAFLMQHGDVPIEQAALTLMVHRQRRKRDKGE